jgi:hypothetical protein
VSTVPTVSAASSATALTAPSVAGVCPAALRAYPTRFGLPASAPDRSVRRPPAVALSPYSRPPMVATGFGVDVEPIPFRVDA